MIFYYPLHRGYVERTVDKTTRSAEILFTFARVFLQYNYNSETTY